jgi:hypothetical protein
MFRWFELVTKDGRAIAEDDLPERDIGKRWDPKWKKLGYKKEIVKMELTSNSNGILVFSCPGPFHVKIAMPKTGLLRKTVEDILDAAAEPTAAIKLVPDMKGTV